MSITEFNKNGYVIVRNALSEQTTAILSSHIKMMKEADLFICNQANLPIDAKFNDALVPNSYHVYGTFGFESTMLYFLPLVEQIIGKDLYPSYSYVRIMGKGAHMERHKDRPSCEFSVTLCIEEDKEVAYPIFMENYGGEVSSIVLHAGDLIVYHGTELNHWREEFTGTQHIQTFFHYVDKNGPYNEFKYDKRPQLGLIKLKTFT